LERPAGPAHRRSKHRPPLRRHRPPGLPEAAG